MSDKQDDQFDTGNDTPHLVSYDFSRSNAIPLPPWANQIGEVACHGGTPNFQSLHAKLAPREDVRPGELLGVWHGERGEGILTVVQVGDCSESNPNETAELQAARGALGLSTNYGKEGRSTKIFRLAVCETLEEFDVLSDNEALVIDGRRAPQTLARAGDPLIRVPKEIQYAALGVLSDPASGLEIGSLFDATELPITLTPQALQLHILATGNPGMGKSYLSGVLVEEARQWDVPVLAIDIHGELLPVAEDIGGKVITLPDPEQFGLSLDLLTSPELVHITPNVQPGTQYAELIELAHDRLKSSGKRPVTFEMLKDGISNLGKNLGTAATSINAAIKRVDELSRDPLMSGNFDFVQQLQHSGFILLDCRYITLRQTQLITAAAARVLQRYGRNMDQKAKATGDKEAANWLSMLYIDEAHLVAPNDDRSVSAQVLRELARMGRHSRTSLLLSSQSPSDLDTSLLKRMQTRFIFALEKDQLRSISGVNSDLSDELINALPKLPRGVCAVSGTREVIGHGFLLEVRKRVTRVGGGTPPVFATRVKKSLEISDGD